MARTPQFYAPKNGTGLAIRAPRNGRAVRKAPDFYVDAEALKGARIACGYSIGIAAKLAGVSPRSITSVEISNQRITAASLARLCYVYHIPISAVLLPVAR